ncbi:unnamed protein product [Amoebophrya sp. A25]|nr:unnamed protein product [Amoebophrya sp. A25]|eukprot:GSA25T00016626001.1
MRMPAASSSSKGGCSLITGAASGAKTSASYNCKRATLWRARVVAQLPKVERSSQRFCAAGTAQTNHAPCRISRLFPRSSRFFANDAVPVARRGNHGIDGTNPAPGAAIDEQVDRLPLVRRNFLQPLGYERLTGTQEQALPFLLNPAKGSALVRAATGSGKTLCYLLSILQQLGDRRFKEAFRPHTAQRKKENAIVEATSDGCELATTAGGVQQTMTISAGVRALILAPSRELALQISHEAAKVFPRSDEDDENGQHLQDDLRLSCLVGGLRGRKADCADLKKRRPDVIVATPGRLLDHFEQTLFFHDLFKNLELLVIDEADRLCDLAFLDDLKRLLSYVSSSIDAAPQGRRDDGGPVRPSGHPFRYLLFSATLPQALETNVIARYVDGSIRRIDCVDGQAGSVVSKSTSSGTFGATVAGERTSDMNPVEVMSASEHGLDEGQSTKGESVSSCCTTPNSMLLAQTAEIQPAENLLAALHHALLREMRQLPTNYKVIVFFPTARLTQFMAAFFRELLRFPILEIHSRKDAHRRLRTSCEFKAAKCGVLFSSDVSARGMDYPEVSLVLQFLAPHSLEQYVHRVGRTARAGRPGRAHILLSQHEMRFADFLSGRGLGSGDVNENLAAQPDEAMTASAKNRSSSANYSKTSSMRTRIMQHVGASLPAVRFLDTENSTYHSEALNAATTAWVSSTTLNSLASAAFASLLGHFKLYTNVLQLNNDQIVQVATLVLTGCGMVQMPVLSQELAEGLGLQDHPGLKIAKDLTAEAMANVPTGGPRVDPTLHTRSRGRRANGGRQNAATARQKFL